MRLAAAVAALVAGYAADGSVPLLAAAAALWLASLALRGLAEVLALLAAPLVLATALPFQGIGIPLLVAAAACVLGLVPLARALGTAGPPPRALATLAAALVVPVLFFVSPVGAPLAASDLAAGAWTLALAAGAVLGTASR